MFPHGNKYYDVQFPNNGISLNTKLIILAVSVVTWMLIMRRWKKQNE
jgi:hypothetical protein